MKQTVIAILPAYNARRTLVRFIRSIPNDLFNEVILVDDCSSDGTYELARKQRGITVYQTPRNMGYGGNLKFCLSKALEAGADIIVELHPDGEYGTDGISAALSEVKSGAHIVLGNRFFRGKPVGMYRGKYYVSRVLTYIYNMLFRTNIPDMHQGFRVYTRFLLAHIPWKSFSNDFLFSFQCIVAAKAYGLHIASVPVTARYSGGKRGATWRNSIRYVLGTVGASVSVFNQINTYCPVCKKDIYVRHKYSWKNYSIFECSGCEIAYTYPRPRDMNSLYPSWLSCIKQRLLPHTPRRQMDVFTRYVLGGTVLDVGSGDGRFSKSLGSTYRVTNFDPYHRAADISSLKRPGLAKQTFDAVVFWESLEHVDDPVATLKKAYVLLKPDGFVFIEYPRYESLDRRVLGKFWLHFDIPRHLFHFTSLGLMRLVGKQGFTIRGDETVFAWEYGTRVGLLVAQKPTTMSFRL